MGPNRMTHGGKRRRHVLPALTPQDVLTVRELKALGMRYKHLMRLYPVSRETLRCAIYGRRTYAAAIRQSQT